MIVSIPSFPARDWMLCQAEFYEKLQRFGYATPLDVALIHHLPKQSRNLGDEIGAERLASRKPRSITGQ
jgi:hypothetical protein